MFGDHRKQFLMKPYETKRALVSTDVALVREDIIVTNVLKKIGEKQKLEGSVENGAMFVAKIGDKRKLKFREQGGPLAKKSKIYALTIFKAAKPEKELAQKPNKNFQKEGFNKTRY